MTRLPIYAQAPRYPSSTLVSQGSKVGLDSSGRKPRAWRAFLGSAAHSRVDPPRPPPVSPSASGLFDSTLALLELSDSNSGDGSPASSALPVRAPLLHAAPLASSAAFFPSDSLPSDWYGVQRKTSYSAAAAFAPAEL